MQDRLTMPIGNAIFTQRSTRKLRPDPIPVEDLHLLMEAAVKAPNGGNNQVARFLIVNDRAKIREFGALYKEAWWAKRWDDHKWTKPEDIPLTDKNHRSAMGLSEDMKDVPCVVCAFTAPDGFAPLFRTSPFLDALGPFYHRRDGRALVLGVRIAQKHCNARGTAHGGLLMTLADIALGYSLAYSEDPPAALTTANLSADFAGSAKLGDWLEARTDIQKLGGRLAFANAYLSVGDERIVRASAVFVRGGRPEA